MLYVVVGLGLAIVLAVLRRKTVRAEGREAEIALIQRIPLTVALRSIADPVALHSIERARSFTGPSGPHGRVLEDASSWFESEGALDSDAPPSRQPFHDKRHLASPANA